MQGVSRQSVCLSSIAAISPLVRSMLPPTKCCPHLPSVCHLLLPQFEDTTLSLLVKIVQGERVVASLRECSQVLEMLLVLGVDTKQFNLEKNETRECVKKEKVYEASHSGDEDRNMFEEEDEVNVVYEGQSSNVTRVSRISFVTVKSEATIDMVTDEDSGLSEPNRARLTPLLSPTPPPAASISSCSESSSFNFEDLVSAGMLARRKDKRVLKVLLMDRTVGASKKVKNN